jgi:hypothetical protein
MPVDDGVELDNRDGWHQVTRCRQYRRRSEREPDARFPDYEAG